MNTFKKLMVSVPILKRIRKIYREGRVLRKHRKVEKYWEGVVNEYFAGKLDKYDFKPKLELSAEKVIWQYWGQGLENDGLPDVVKMCFNSVDKYKGAHKVIRLNDETLTQYLDIPEFVWEKMKNPAFERVFFSDLLRLALLKAYGGVWLDATILLTGPLPAQFTELEYFVYQRDDNVPNQSYWEDIDVYYWGWRPEFKVRMLSSIMFAKKDNVVISALLDLMLHYWKTQNLIINYFFLQILYTVLLEKHFVNEKCPIVSDIKPHLLQTQIKDPNNSLISDKDILEAGPIHKTRYKSNKEDLERLKLFYEKYV